MEQNRWRSKAAWVTLIAQAVLVIGIWLPEVSETVKIVGTALLAVAAGFGAFNDPTSKAQF